ncbi:MAG: hypothetical protein GY786_01760 [Proteobacteria bacterium]|nr:hypothetical protein [Pseudomonadota bacterium]
MIVLNKQRESKCALLSNLIQHYAIDVSSGVESAPGIKSISKIKTLINNIQSLS